MTGGAVSGNADPHHAPHVGPTQPEPVTNVVDAEGTNRRRARRRKEQAEIIDGMLLGHAIWAVRTAVLLGVVDSRPHAHRRVRETNSSSSARAA